MIRTDRAALYVLIFLLGASALAFGSVEHWAQEFLRLGALLVAALVLWSRPPSSLFSERARSVVLPGALVVVWGLLQCVPLPRTVLAAVSPRAASTYAGTVPAPGTTLEHWLASRAGEHGIRVEAGGDAMRAEPPERPAAVGRSLSIYPHGTLRACLSWATALLFFVAAAALARDERARYRLLFGIAGWAAVLGALAIAQQASWNDRLLWFRPVPEGSQPLGPFVGPNHFAGYVEMGALVGLGLVLALLSKPEGRLSLRGAREALLDREWALPRLLLVGGFTILAFAGLLLSGSRGGLLAAGVGLLVLGARRFKAVLPAAAPAAAVAGVAAGLVAALGRSQGALERGPLVSAGTDASMFTRLDAWGKTLRIFLEYPWTGSGLGSFRWVFPSVQREGEWMVWGEAHNDFLEFLAGAGLVGGVLLSWAVWRYSRSVLVPCAGRGATSPRWTTTATAAAVVAMLVHTIYDFNLQIPSNAALFATLAGVLAAAAEDAP